MSSDVEKMLRTGAQTDPAASRPDLADLWVRGRARRRRMRTITASSTLGVLLAASLVVVGWQLMRPIVVEAPFLGNGSGPTETTPAAEHAGGPTLLPPNDVFEDGGALHCSGLHRLSPWNLARRLETLGYRPEWRHMSESNVQVPLHQVPADAVVTSTVLDESDGTLYLFSVPSHSSDATEADRYEANCD